MSLKTSIGREIIWGSQNVFVQTHKGIINYYTNSRTYAIEILFFIFYQTLKSYYQLQSTKPYTNSAIVAKSVITSDLPNIRLFSLFSIHFILASKIIIKNPNCHIPIGIVSVLQDF